MSTENSQPAQPEQPVTLDSIASLLSESEAAGGEGPETPAPAEEESSEEQEVETGDAPADEEVEASAESEEEADEPEDDDPLEEWETAAGKRYALKRSELRNGYMRQDDYQRKTAALAEQRKVYETASQGLDLERQVASTQLRVLMDGLHKQLVGDEQKLAQLIETDPHEYLRQREAMGQRTALLQQAFHAQQQMEQQNQVQAHLQQEAYVQEQHAALVEKLPEWRSEKARTEAIKPIVQYLSDMGYSAEELNQLQDHRALLIARDAAAYRAMQNAKSKKVAPPVRKVVKPGNNNSPNIPDNSRANLAKKALDKDNRNRGALAALIEESGF